MFNKKNFKNDVDEAAKTFDFSKNKYTAMLETNLGTIKLLMESEVAPGHVKNFLGLSKIGYYDGLSFHRIIEGFMIQGGCPEGSGVGGPGYKIKAEFNELPHEAGVLSMARTQDPDSGGSQFFICLGKHAYLDRQYTVFGKTADEESLAVVKKLGSLPTDPGDKPRSEATIKKVTIEEKPI